VNIRFTDILTTATALAHYLGEPEVTPRLLRDSVAILREEKAIEDFGPGRSPFIPRDPMGATVPRTVRELTQAWFHRLGDDPTVELEEGAVDEFLQELAALDGDE